MAYGLTSRRRAGVKNFSAGTIVEVGLAGTKRNGGIERQKQASRQHGLVRLANTTIKFGILLISPFFAQLYSMLLGLLLNFEQLALDSLNLDDRSGLGPLINNTN